MCLSTKLSHVWCLFSQKFLREVFLANFYFLYLSTIYTLALVSLICDDTKCFKIISSPTDIISLQNANQALNWSDLMSSFSMSLSLSVGFVRLL